MNKEPHEREPMKLHIENDVMYLDEMPLRLVNKYVIESIRCGLVTLTITMMAEFCGKQKERIDHESSR